jgi:hypothetical protein
LAYDADTGAVFVNPSDAHPELGANLYVFRLPGGMAESFTNYASLDADDTNSRLETRFGNNRINLQADDSGGAINVVGIFHFNGVSETASDASARLTVGGTEYSVAKCIRMQDESGDTYFWPLFGPVTP